MGDSGPQGLPSTFRNPLFLKTFSSGSVRPHLDLFFFSRHSGLRDQLPFTKTCFSFLRNFPGSIPPSLVWPGPSSLSPPDRMGYYKLLGTLKKLSCVPPPFPTCLFFLPFFFLEKNNRSSERSLSMGAGPPARAFFPFFGDGGRRHPPGGGENCSGECEGPLSQAPPGGISSRDKYSPRGPAFLPPIMAPQAGLLLF